MAEPEQSPNNENEQELAVVPETDQEREERRARSLFSEETFLNAADLRQSPAGDKIYKSILKARISMQAKRSLMKIACVFNGTDILLSNLTKISNSASMYQSNDNYGVKLKLELAFLKATASMTKHDTMSADLFSIRTAIGDLAFLHFTRAQGDKRERMINGVLRREDDVTQRVGNITPIQPQALPNKKWWQKG